MAQLHGMKLEGFSEIENIPDLTKEQEEAAEKAMKAAQLRKVKEYSGG